MFPSFRGFPQNLRLFGLIVVAGVVLVSCGPTTKSAGESSAYDRAKDAFKSGQLDKALDLTDKLATATPPADSTDRARVLRAVIYTGELKSTKELAEAYSKGAEKAEAPQTRSGYRRLQHDILVNAAKAALNLAGTAHQIAPDGVIAKELTLEASFPTTEGPPEIKELATIEKGNWIDPDQQDSASGDALRKGVDDTLADVVGGDRAKARQALASGSTKLEGTAFAIFLARELAEGAVVFDRHHGLDPPRLRMLCDEGDESLKAALALLKDTPNKDQEKEVKKLQDKFKTIRKDK
jgi:hypothetical protein